MVEGYQDDTLHVFSLDANRPSAEKITASVGAELRKSTMRQSSNGEIQINIEEGIRGDHVYIIQATNVPADDHLVELLVLVDALKRTSAKAADVILPCHDYVRRDCTAKSKEPTTVKLVANMSIEASVTRLLTLDLHTVQVQRFFDTPVDNLFIIPLFAHYHRQQVLVGEEIVVASPKNSGVQRTHSSSEHLDAALAIVDHKGIDGVCQEDYVIGNVTGKRYVLVNGISNAGQTLAAAAEALVKSGTQEMYTCAPHGLLLEDVKATLENAPIKGIGITGSIYMAADRQPATLGIISCAELVGKALLHTHKNKPMSPLFRSEPKGEQVAP